MIPTGAVVRSVLAMCFSRLGSLNALEQTKGSSLWRRWLDGHDLPSADTIARVMAGMDPAGVRAFTHHVYDRLKRGKALAPPAHGWLSAVVDGHETHASYKRRCPGCLERVIHTAQGDRIQYYHRLVAVSLVTQDQVLLLDAEPQRRGEDEVAAALRLLERVIEHYPRAFDLVQGDALYADPRFFNWATAHGKHALAVLKGDERDLVGDAEALMAGMPPTTVRHGTTLRECWDLEGFTTWPSVTGPVRVVRCRETASVRRQLDRQVETTVSQWLWVTTLPAAVAPTAAVVQMGHRRWGIENQGFNELVTQYQADHVYRHEPTAILLFWLLTQLCLNVFVAFFRRNLKPAVRRAVSMLHVARQVQAELYHTAPAAPT